MSHPRRTFVENATPAGTLWAIIMPPSNSGRSQILAPSIIARGSFREQARFPLPSAFPLSTLSHGSPIRLLTPSICLFARHSHSISRYHLGNASHSNQCSSTPLDHLLATDGRNAPPQSAAHARSFAVRHFTLLSTVNLKFRHKSRYRNSRFVRYPAVITPTRQSSRGPIPRLMRDESQYRLPPMATAT